MSGRESHLPPTGTQSQGAAAFHFFLVKEGKSKDRSQRRHYRSFGLSFCLSLCMLRGYPCHWCCSHVCLFRENCGEELMVWPHLFRWRGWQWHVGRLWWESGRRRKKKDGLAFGCDLRNRRIWSSSSFRFGSILTQNSGMNNGSSSKGDGGGGDDDDDAAAATAAGSHFWDFGELGFWHWDFGLRWSQRTNPGWIANPFPFSVFRVLSLPLDLSGRDEIFVLFWTTGRKINSCFTANIQKDQEERSETSTHFHFLLFFVAASKVLHCFVPLSLYLFSGLSLRSSLSCVNVSSLSILLQSSSSCFRMARCCSRWCFSLARCLFPSVYNDGIEGSKEK